MLSRLVLIGLLGGWLSAQIPWTRWNIYRDSTGSGVDPVEGVSLCPNDTVWLVVDTTGMNAAGITGYRWRLQAMAEMFYPTSDFFPWEGLANSPKVRIRFLLSGMSVGATLTTYHANGDSSTIIRYLRLRSPQIRISPFPWDIPLLCANSSIRFQLRAEDVDSFKVGFGPNPSDTIRNQTEFQLTIPAGSSWQIDIIYYACGESYAQSLNYPIGTPSPQPLFYSPFTSAGFCPGQAILFNFPSNTYTGGITNYTLTIRDQGGGVVTTADTIPFTWTIPSALPVRGNYTAEYTLSYPCGSVQGSVGFRIHGGDSTLSQPFVSFTPNSNYCLATPVRVSIYGEGIVSIDIGGDQSWDYVRGASGLGPISITDTPTTLPRRYIIRQELDCAARQDTFDFNPSTTNPTPSGSLAYRVLGECPNDPIRLRLDYYQNMNFSLPGTYIEYVVPWLNGGAPFRVYRPETTITGPSTPGSYNIRYRLYNSCGQSSAQQSLQIFITHQSYLTGARIIGRICGASDSIGIYYTGLSSSIDRIRYIFSNGYVTNWYAPRDTHWLRVPPDVTGIVAEGLTPCGETFLYLTVPTGSTTPIRIGLSSSHTQACNGSTTVVSVYGSGARVVEVYDPNNALIRREPVLSSPNGMFYFPIYIPVTAPAGVYTWKIVGIGCGNARDSVPFPINVLPGETYADFSAPLSGCVNQPVTFQRLGSNVGFISAEWNFGDGSPLSYDTARTVRHTYAQAGVYRVHLFVASQTCGYSRVERLISIYDSPPTLSNLNVSVSGNTLSYSVAATEADSVVWEFGDGNRARGLSGTHTYTASGSYTVRVTAYNGCGPRSETRTVQVIPTSLASASSSGAWRLYPNPTNGEIYLTHPTYAGKVLLRVCDLMGREIRQEEVESVPARLSLRVPAGVYLLQLRTLEGLIHFRLVVEE
ncbi:MAG: PKD domain-containing protein [Bacteroidia bacterium]|nr:PKD domain-containing protein [Bacteroidia bacterium]MDW8089477.1 PKD domain-containing protein [Bacteroidia bacterium]